MNAPRNWSKRLFGRIAGAGRALASKVRTTASDQAPSLRRWPNLAPTEPVPADPADHAENFAHRWVDRMENAAEGRMHALEVPEEQIGSSDRNHGVEWRTYFPHAREGGSVSPGGRINIDSGVLNPDLMKKLGPRASEAWAAERLRNRIDAILAHEFEEARGGTHEYAVDHAPETELAISDHVRSLLRAIQEGEKGRRR
ncbi:MAG TPA: hypothetical protein VGY53_11625 [Isosphaeraceae bacterium]|nr:hypothetical protein [Isosphaeraceae bacterium]